MGADARIDRFLEHGGLSAATRRAYGSDLRALAGWLDARGETLDDVDARVLSDWVADLGSGRDRLSAASISRRLAAVRSCLRYTFGPARVPEAALAPSKSRRLPDAPKPAEIDEILELVSGASPLALRNRALLELLYSAGLRSQEAVSLDLRDVDFEREIVHVRGKGDKERVVPLGEAAARPRALYLRTGRPELATGAAVSSPPTARTVRPAATAAMTCVTMYAPYSVEVILPRTKTAVLTAGLKCPPET